MNLIYSIYRPHDYIFAWTHLNIATESFFTYFAFFFFTIWIIRRLKKDNIEPEPKNVFLLLFWGILGSLAGGRIWYYLENWHGFQTLIDLFDITLPGLVSHGMIIGGIISMAMVSHFISRKNPKKDCKIMLAKYMDVIAISTALFIFIYRMGCFHFGDIPGTPTKLPWGLFTIHYGRYTGTIMHPTALYLSFSGLLIFFFLNWYKTKRRFDGELGLLFLALYSFNRFWIEFLRNGISRTMGISEIQWIDLILFIIVICSLTISYTAMKHFKLKNYKEVCKFEAGQKEPLYLHYLKDYLKK